MSTSANVSSSQSHTKTPEFLTGVVERLTYHSQESGYTVARVQTPRTRDLITIVGEFANIQAGQTLQLKGFWREHPQYGQQFQVVHYTETKPATLTGMEKYLGSGLIKGVGPVTAKRIVAHFGLETLEVIENQIHRLIEVPGIASKRIKQIQSAWETQKSVKEVMVFLQGHGVSTLYAVKIFKQYGEGAIATVTNNPYQLATDIYGIGFLTADKIAQNIGISPWSKYRYSSGLLHVLSQASEDGHCFLPQPELVDLTVQLLTSSDHEAEPETVRAVTEQMGQSKELIVEAGEGRMPLCYQPSFFYTEQHLAKLMLQHLSRPVAVDLARVKDWIARFTSRQGLSLSPQQQQAVEIAARERVMVLTGG
ncbi:MAG: helix-hairpin-helix domain-containing protein, partial [Microcystaceae cyanobacterium]